MRRSERRAGPDWKHGFPFVGNQLALDFLNTRPVENGKASELLPDFRALVRWFRAAGVLHQRQADQLIREWAGSPAGNRAVDSMRWWRERLRKQLIAWEEGASLHPATVKELNRLMAEHPMRLRLSSKNKPTTELWFEPRRPEDLFAPLAQSAAALFAAADRERIRKCGQCVLHFHDTSKKGTRRWCSMRLCGNRLKVAAYAARRRRPAKATKKISPPRRHGGTEV